MEEDQRAEQREKRGQLIIGIWGKSEELGQVDSDRVRGKRGVIGSFRFWLSQRVII
jgi:hypothetical protein